ncbi:MAG: tetratricopeptide repeat protein [Thermoguttaceae bacterium]
MRVTRLRSKLSAGCLIAGCLLLPCHASGGEPCQAFLDGLRSPNRQLYDLALDYLEAMRSSPLADPAFREAIDYEVGVTLAEGARLLPPGGRQRQQHRAAECFQKFLSDHPHHAKTVDAQKGLADLLIDRGHDDLERAWRAGRVPQHQEQLLAQSRRSYEAAQQVLLAMDRELAAQRGKLKDMDPADPAFIPRRDHLWRESLTGRLAYARTYYDLAHTYAPGSDDSRRFLRTAALELGRYYDKYKRFPVANCALIDQARCYSERGDYAQCLEILGRLVKSQTEDDDAVRRLRIDATELAMQTTLLPAIKKYRETLGLYDNWDAKLRRAADPAEQAASLRCLAAEGALELARTLDDKNPEQATLRAGCRKRAADLLGPVAHSPGEHQKKARTLLADPLLAGGIVRDDLPGGYEEARRRALQAWRQLQEPSLKPDDVERLRNEALDCFRIALADTPENVSIDQLNGLRFCLGSLNWQMGNYYDAAVLGEFLARQHRDGPQGQQGADLARLAYLELLSDPDGGEGRQFAIGRLRNLARYASERWPAAAVADEAWLALMRAEIACQDPLKAAKRLENIPAESPLRPEAELTAGQALWSTYLAAMRLPETRRPPKSELTSTLTQARKLLEDGIARRRKTLGPDKVHLTLRMRNTHPAERDEYVELPNPLPAAVLSLAQIDLEAGEGAQAVALVDDPKIGPHTLLKADDKAAATTPLGVETFKAALRAYVATQQLDKADRAMAALEKAGGATNLTAIYVALGRQLEESLRRAREDGKPDQAAALARGFQSFLNRIADRPPEEATFNSLYWVAETLVSLGAGTADGDPLSPEGRSCCEKGAEVYRRIIQRCEKDETFGPRPGVAAGVRVRLARCLRLLGKHDQALDLLVEVLRTRATLIDAQREAAATCQARGEQEPAYLLLAIRGGMLPPQKSGATALFWGWAGIARKVQFLDAYQDLFDEARYNLASCRLDYAMSRPEEEKTGLLRQAEQDILVLQRLRPEMGGKKWYPRYDALLRKIQGRLGIGEEQQGLKAAEERLSRGRSEH